MIGIARGSAACTVGRAGPATQSVGSCAQVRLPHEVAHTPERVRRGGRTARFLLMAGAGGLEPGSDLLNSCYMYAQLCCTLKSFRTM